MSSLRAPHLGPLVGHTTDTTARIWIRGGDEDEKSLAAQRRTLGVMALVEKDGRPIAQPIAHYFRLRREYDRTGTFTLGEELGIRSLRDEAAPLEPDTEYVARVGTLTIDDPNPTGESLPSSVIAERLADPRAWIDDLLRLEPARSEARFRTFPAGEAVLDSLTFLLGSCRYPGLLWQAKSADTIFGPMYDHVTAKKLDNRARFVLMVGDQIYADRMNRNIPIGLADSFAEFQERYHGAFGSVRMRRLLRHVPTYMILDDHEIEDNWSQDRVTKEKHRTVFNIAINAYKSYQWVHGPSVYEGRLFYEFACGGYPFFVLDTRTQRYMDDVQNSLEDNHLLGRPSLDERFEPSQLDLLVRWLVQSQKDQGDRPKFIVSSSVFAPSPMDARTGRRGPRQQQVKWRESSDSWPAFPKTRERILRAVVDHGIQNVVFLSGDIHCSNVAALDFEGAGAEPLKMASITSSALYWPFPFADGEPSSFVHDSRKEGQEDPFAFDTGRGRCTMHYSSWNFTQEDNFCRVQIDRDRHRLVVVPYGADGDQVERGGWFGVGGKKIRSTLELAPW